MNDFAGHVGDLHLASFEATCSVTVEAEITGWTRTFAKLGLPFNEAAFRAEAQDAINHVIRTALFYGADLTLEDAAQVSLIEARV